MSPRMWISIFISTIVILSSTPALSQTDRNVKRGVATVLFASLGGAVLGLSTLSFYGEPEEHTSNITLGAAVGFVGGLAYVLSGSRQSAPSDHYSVFPEAEFKNRRALAFHSAKAPLFQIYFDFN